jgi:hypothetical protein
MGIVDVAALAASAAGVVAGDDHRDTAADQIGHHPHRNSGVRFSSMSRHADRRSICVFGG